MNSVSTNLPFVCFEDLVPSWAWSLEVPGCGDEVRAKYKQWPMIRPDLIMLALAAKIKFSGPADSSFGKSKILVVYLYKFIHGYKIKVNFFVLKYPYLAVVHLHLMKKFFSWQVFFVCSSIFIKSRTTTTKSISLPTSL